MAFEPRFSITNAITAALTEIERARGFLEAATLTDEWVDAMRSRGVSPGSASYDAHRGNAAYAEGRRRAAGGASRAGSGPGRRPRASQLP